MTVAFELGRDFLDREDIPLSIDDLKYGFERGWLRAPTVIDWAVREFERGDDDPALLEVASLLRDEVDDLPDLLAQLDSPDHIHDPRESARKWLYLQLRAAFERRHDLDDPLGVVEEIYADFEYPARRLKASCPTCRCARETSRARRRSSSVGQRSCSRSATR